MQDLLASLVMEDMDSRQSDIAPPYERTFEWVWTDTEVGYISWLQSETGMYWISGKPGSGKSTLMKYIYRNGQTRENLAKRDPSERVICPNFFFHNRGTKDQKSLQGLLRSILCQVFSAETRLLDSVIKGLTYDQRSRDRRLHLTQHDLMEMITLIRDQSDTEILICLFLDALDEYDGDPEAVTYFLRSLTSLPYDSKTKIKICFSSRLYNVFIDEFWGCPGVKIHERTLNDVEQVIAGRISQSQSMMALLAGDNQQAKEQLEEMKREIIRRAEGVFLWVKFALDNLLRAHREGETMTGLLQRLSLLPNELGRFYQLIIENIPAEYRRETYVLLEAVLRYSGDLTIRELDGILASSTVETLGDSSCGIIQSEFVDSAEGQFARRLRSRCGGLLDLKQEFASEKLASSSDSSPQQRAASRIIVSFMHQTVKEFVAQPGFRKLVLPLERDAPMENGHSFISKYGLCRLYNSADVPAGYSASRFYLSHTTEAEQTTGRSQKHLLDQLLPSKFPALHETLPSRYRYPRRSPDPNSVLAFAVLRNLRLYVSETLEEFGKHVVNHNPVRSLLHFAIDPNARRLAYHGDHQESLDMVDILLRAGASIDATIVITWRFYTPFQAVFHGLSNYRDELYDPSTIDFNNPRYFNVLRDVTRLTQHLLELGSQDPNQPVFLKGGVECNALHLSTGPLTRILLEHGADVNALDHLGRSPLDLVARGRLFDLKFRSHSRAAIAYDTAIQLINRGGRCQDEVGATRSYQSATGQTPIFDALVGDMKDAGYDTGPFEDERQRLQDQKKKQNSEQKQAKVQRSASRKGPIVPAKPNRLKGDRRELEGLLPDSEGSYANIEDSMAYEWSDIEDIDGIVDEPRETFAEKRKRLLERDIRL